jgi:hypothetical protein
MITISLSVKKIHIKIFVITIKKLNNFFYNNLNESILHLVLITDLILTIYKKLFIVI